MKYVTLGTNIKLKTSEFCLGVLPMGPLQADLPEKKCIEIIKKAIDMNVNFVDTAELYQTQTYIGKAIKGKREKVIIASKSNAKTYDEMSKSVDNSLQELDTNYIDIYHLHAAKASETVFEERKGALKYLTEMKKKGIIKAVGISTHGVNAAKKTAEIDEIDIVYPIINKTGLGLFDGNTREMIEAIKKCHQAGKGIYAMKVLGGGTLINELKENINWVRNIKEVDAISVGVTSLKELEYNLYLFGHKDVEPKELPDTTKQKKIYISENSCRGCESCIEACPNDALSIKEDKAVADHDKCILCGYCAPHCPYFAIRVL